MQRDIEKMKNGALSLEQVLKRVGGTIGIAFGASQVKDFARKVIEVRGEVEKLQISLKTLAGEEAGTKLYEDMRDFVVKTPLLMSTVAQGAQTLLSFNIEASKVMPILKQIGDISMGDAQKFQSLTLAFAQMSSTGKLMGQDLLQMINAGFNPLVVISEQTGKSISQLKDEMAKGAISVEMVENAFRSATEEGGLFHGMLEKQSHGIEGALSNLQGSIEDMFNDIGSKGQDAIVDSIGMATDLVKHYEDVAKVLGVVIAAWGTYRGALLLVAAAQKAMTVLRTAQAFVVQARSVKSASEAMAMFNAVSSVNPFVALLGALAGATAAFFLFRDSEDASAEASRRYSEAIIKETSNIKALYAAMTSSSSNSKVARDSAKELKAAADEYGVALSENAQKIGNESELISELTAKREELIDAIEREAVAKEHANLVEDMTDRYTEQLGEVRKAFESALPDELSKQARGMMASLVTDDDIAELGRLQKALHDTFDPSNLYSPAHQAALDEWRAKQQELTARMQQFTMELGKAEGDSARYASVAKDVTDAVEAMTRGYGKSNEEFRNGEIALANSTLAHQRQVRAETAHKASVESLTSVTSALITIWNSEHTMTLKIHYDDSEIPQWMKGLSVDQLKRSLAVRQQAIRSGRDVISGNRRFSAKDERTAREAAQLSQVLGEKTSSPSQSPTPPSTPKSAKSTKGGGKEWDAREHAARSKQLQEEWSKELEKFAEEKMDELSDANIANLRESTDKQLKQIDQDEKKELKALDDEVAALIDKRKALDKKLWTEGGKGRKDYEAPEESDDEALQKIYAEQPDLEKILGERRQSIMESYQKKRDEVRKEELQSMNDYMQRYGSQLQQQLALEREYEQKKKDAKNDWERKQIDEEYKEKAGQIRMQDVEQSIDWVALFRGVGSMTTDMAHVLREQLNAFVGSDGFKSADPQLQEKVVEALGELRQYLGSDPDNTWDELGRLMSEFQQATAVYDNAKAREQEVYETLQVLQSKREDTAEGSDTSDLDQQISDTETHLMELGDQTKKAKEALDALGVQVNAVADDLKNFVPKGVAKMRANEGWKGVEGYSGITDKLEEFGKIGRKADELKAGMSAEDKSGVAGAMADVVSGIGDTVGNALSGGLGDLLGEAVGGMIGLVAQIPKMILQLSDMVKNLVSGILDSFTELLKFEWLEDLIVSITSSIGNLVEAVFKLPENLFHVLESIIVDGIGNMLGSIIGNILSAVGLGDYGPSSWFGGDGAKLAKEIARLEERNADLIEAMDSLRESFENSSGAELVASYEEAIKMQQEINANNQKIILNQMRYSGSHSSWAHEWGYLTDEQRAMISRQIGKEFVRKTGSDLSYDTSRYWTDSAAGLAQLTAEEWQIIRGNADVWNRIKSTGDYGGRVAEKIESFIEQAGALEDLTSSLYENLTNISFDSMFDSFVDKIADMNSEAEDFADDFESYMKKAVIRSMATELFRDKLKAWYEAFADRMGQVDWSKGAQGFSAKVMDELLNGGGTYKDAVTGEQKRFESWNSIVEDGLKMRDLIQQVLGFSGEGSSQSGKSGAYSAMSQDQGTKLEGLFVSGQMHWASIDERAEEVVRQMGAASDHLRRIEENTGKSASELKEIKEEIVRIVRDGLKVK